MFMVVFWGGGRSVNETDKIVFTTWYVAALATACTSYSYRIGIHEDRHRSRSIVSANIDRAPSTFASAARWWRAEIAAGGAAAAVTTTRTRMPTWFRATGKTTTATRTGTPEERREGARKTCRKTSTKCADFWPSPCQYVSGLPVALLFSLVCLAGGWVRPVHPGLCRRLKRQR